MSDSGWRTWLADETATIRAADQWRAPRTFDAAGPTGTLAGAGPVVSFASNDYLGLSQHPAVKAAAAAATERWGTGSGASRLVVGSRPVHEDLEAALARWRGTEAAVVFSTGYAANLGVLATLGGAGVRIYSDALNHASIVDGCRLAKATGAELRVYAHGDVDRLAELLAEPGPARRIVVTDVVFSMDGDVAPVDRLRALCAAHDALLVLDEAHSVLQPPSASARPGGPPEVQVGTLSKALGALGGFVAADRSVTDLLVNRARPYIFTTAPSPADAAAALAAVGVVQGPEGAELRARLRAHVTRILPGHPTPVLAVVAGTETAAMAASRSLLDRGLHVPAIRPPTVPPGTSRLRIALSAAHTDDQIDRLAHALRDLGLDPGAPTAGGRPLDADTRT